MLLPLLAHLEYALREHGADLPAVKAYFRRPDVTAEIICCTSKWQAACSPRLTGRGTTVRHWLALTAYLSDRNREQARVLLTEIGPHLGDTPVYGYFWADPADGFHTVQRWSKVV